MLKQIGWLSLRVQLAALPLGDGFRAKQTDRGIARVASS